jgi:carboxyl-terminal processing protease
VQGVVLDLRRNGGGSLQEAINLGALFVGGGPIVQTRDAKGDVEVGTAGGAPARYTGPLVVLTSRFSASASEIVAGALQDYGRALVVGDTSTFGKGTVQAITPLAPVMKSAGLAHAFDPGALKVTIAKFYRPSGASTELRGVASDIVIPSASGVLPVGESKLVDPLPWDTIAPAHFTVRAEVAPYLAGLRDASSRRIAAEPAFKDLRQQIARLESRIADNTISLNEAERRRESALDKLIEKSIASEAKVEESGIPSYEITVKDAASAGLPPRAPSLVKRATDRRASGDDAKDAKADEAALADGLVLDESLHILADYVSLRGHPPAPQQKLGANVGRR